MFPPAFWPTQPADPFVPAGSNVVLWGALEMMRKSIRYGISPYCAYPYAVWARTLSGKLSKPLEE